MITLKNVKTIDGKTVDHTLSSEIPLTIDATDLTLFPGLIDPHVHFRTPGFEHKENWETASLAAIRGGYTTVFDMPNTSPATICSTSFEEKKLLIEKQLQKAKIPLRFELYLGADKNHFDEIAKLKNEMIALKIYMGSSTGDLLMDDDSSLHAAFAIASSLDLLICVHAEDEHMIQLNKKRYESSTSYDTHSLIRTPLVAASAVKKAISLSRLYRARLHILHVSTKDELNLIEEAKNKNLPVTCEVTPHHLFLDTNSYASLHGRALVNPSLKEPSHKGYLLDGIKRKIIDVVGSDHAPHTLEEKELPYGKAPSGMPGVETNLPLLLTAFHQNLLTLEEIVSLTCTNIQKIYRIKPNSDALLVDLNKEQKVSSALLKTKCGWSPFEGMLLKGWPAFVILKETVFDLQKEECLCPV